MVPTALARAAPPVRALALVVVLVGLAFGATTLPGVRDDHPGFNEEWGKKNIALAINATGDGVDLTTQPLPVMPDELAVFFEEGH